jgi:hypothetical protein
VADKASRDVEADEGAEEGEGEADGEVGEREERVLRVRATNEATVVEDDAGEQRVGSRAWRTLVGGHHVSFLQK